MISAKRAAPFLCIAAFTLTLLYLKSQDVSRSWRDLPPIPGEGDFVPEQKAAVIPTLRDDTFQPVFLPGTPKTHGSNYTRALVMPRMPDEDVSWIDEENMDVIKAIYVVNDTNAELRTPANKGHEVMVYLTYIIQHYDVLPDISIFMHAHRYSWHNSELLNHDAAEMIRRLSSERVIREGFMNLRCDWDPGCPDWMHPGTTPLDPSKPEETLIAANWATLFPGLAVPTTLAQPCCAQFAVSRERIRAVARARWAFYREWLLATELSDHLSGRIWEYLWQVVFTGESWVCRAQHECYCDGFGVCFEDGARFESFRERGRRRDEERARLDAYLARVGAWEEFRAKGRVRDGVEVEEPVAGREEEMRERVEGLDRELEEERSRAVERGASASVRARIAGRVWTEGDGF